MVGSSLYVSGAIKQCTEYENEVYSKQYEKTGPSCTVAIHPMKKAKHIIAVNTVENRLRLIFDFMI